MVENKMELCFGTFLRCTSNAIQGHFTMQYNRNDNMMSPYSVMILSMIWG